MKASKDYWYDFAGFSGVPSRAHIRLLHEEGKPFIVICSQPIHGAGTSVQNAYEIIKSDVLAKIRKDIDQENRKAIASSVDELAETVKSSSKMTTAIASWLLSKLARYLRRETVHRVFIRPELRLIWLEHWPPGCMSLGPPDDYLLVREDQSGNPSWVRVDTGKLARETGYTNSQIRKNEDVFNTLDPKSPDLGRKV